MKGANEGMNECMNEWMNECLKMKSPEIINCVCSYPVASPAIIIYDSNLSSFPFWLKKVKFDSRDAYFHASVDLVMAILGSVQNPTDTWGLHWPCYQSGDIVLLNRVDPSFICNWPLRCQQADKQANKQANEQANKRTNKQAHKRANKASKQTNKQTHTLSYK